MLIENTLFGIENKVEIAIARLRHFEPPEGYYLAFSGGKDSCVIKHLTQMSGVKFDAHYNLTTVDPPELVYFIREYHADVEVHKPKLSMWQLIIKKKMLPMRMSRYCCEVLKEGGGAGRLVVTGIRWAESARRSKRQMVEQCYTDHSKRFIHPIIDWSENEVWEYIHKYNIPYCSLYDEGQSRIGCVMCPMRNAKGMRADAERWPKFANMYKWACNKAFEKMVKEKPDKERSWKSGEDMYNHWIGGKRIERVDPNQMGMFE